jgi:hypothetical protein
MPEKKFIFPPRYYATCVSTALTVLILQTFKVSISFIVTLYYNTIVLPVPVAAQSKA